MSTRLKTPTASSGHKPIILILKVKSVFQSKVKQMNFRSTFTPPEHFSFSHRQLKFLKLQCSIFLRGHSQRTSGKMLIFFTLPLSVIVQIWSPPSPLGHPACFKNVCNFRFVTIIISPILLKNAFGKFFILLISMKQSSAKFLKDKAYRIMFL